MQVEKNIEDFLPVELWFKIIEFSLMEKVTSMSLKTFCILRRTCKFFKIIVEDDKIKFLDMISFFNNYPIHTYPPISNKTCIHLNVSIKSEKTEKGWKQKLVDEHDSNVTLQWNINRGQLCKNITNVKCPHGYGQIPDLIKKKVWVLPEEIKCNKKLFSDELSSTKSSFNLKKTSPSLFNVLNVE